MIVEEHKYSEDNDGHDDEPFKHITQQHEQAGDGQQQVPGDVYGR